MELIGRGGERLDSQILRDFLRIKEDDHLSQITSSTSGGGDSSGLTLSEVLSDKRAPPPPLQRVQSNRTLLDIIREDQTSGLGRRDGRKSWRQLRDRIRLRRGAWSSDGFPLNSNRTTMVARRSSFRLDSGEPNQSAVVSTAIETRSSGRFDLASSLPRRRLISEESDNSEEEERGGVEEEAAAEQPVRMSLMALLAETDRQLGFEGSAYLMYDEEEAEEEETTGNCCVCLVRHKGAAFIPCGHTFCRLCSRELWVQRRNCPLCNNYIKEILDIF